MEKLNTKVTKTNSFFGTQPKLDRREEPNFHQTKNFDAVDSKS